MASERRVTRSAKAVIPDYQPLPPRRDPPRKKGQRPLQVSSEVISTGKEDSSAGTFTRDSESERRIEINVEDGLEPPPKVPNRPSRPLPQRKAAANRAIQLDDPDSVDAMFISGRAGYRSLASPNPSTSASATKPSTSSDPPTNTANHSARLERMTFVTDRGFTIQKEVDPSQVQDLLDGKPIKNPGSPTTRRRDETPGPDFRDNEEDEEGDEGNEDDGPTRPDRPEGSYDVGQSDDEGDAGDREILESSPDASDFEDAVAEVQRRRDYKATLYARELTPTMEEQDLEDEHEFEDVPCTPPSSPRIPASRKGKKRSVNPNQQPRASATEEPSPPRIPASKKGKQRAVNPNQQLQAPATTETGDEEQVKDDEVTTGGFAPGPIPEASKKKAYAVHQRYLEELEEIARECNKPVRHFRVLLGEDVKSTRRMSAWDAYERWYTVEVEPKPKDVNIQEWSKYVSKHYNKEMDELKATCEDEKPTQAEIEEHFKVQFDFVRNGIKSYLSDKHDSQTFSSVISKVTDPFVRMSMNVAAEFGVHIFGFAVETSPESCSSVAWGGSEEYKYLRDTHKTVIATQLHDYEGMFKIAEMRQRGLASIQSLVNLGRKHGENERDHYRRLIGEFLRSDLARIYAERDDSPQDDSKLKMHWPSWTEFAYKNNLRLVGWAKNTPHPKEQFLLKSLKLAPLKSMAKPRMTLLERAMKKNKDDSESEDDFGSDIVHIESWTEDEISMSVRSQRSVPLVVDVDGTTLSTAFDSKAYIARLKSMGQLSSRTRLDDSDGAEMSDDEELHPRNSVESKKPKQQKGKKRGRSQFEGEHGGHDEVEADVQVTSANVRPSGSRRPAQKYVEVASSDPDVNGTPAQSPLRDTSKFNRAAASPTRSPLLNTSTSNRATGAASGLARRNTSNTQHIRPPPSNRGGSHQETSNVNRTPTHSPSQSNTSNSKHAAAAATRRNTSNSHHIPPPPSNRVVSNQETISRVVTPPPKVDQHSRGVEQRGTPPHRDHLYDEPRHPSHPSRPTHFYGYNGPRDMPHPPNHQPYFRGDSTPGPLKNMSDDRERTQETREMKRRRIEDVSADSERFPIPSGSRHTSSYPGGWDENRPPYQTWPPRDAYPNYPYDSRQTSHSRHFDDPRNHYHENSRRPPSPNSYYRDPHYYR